MTYKRLVEILAFDFEMPKARVGRLLARTFGQLRIAVKADGRVAVPGFGVFLKTQRKARQIRKPPSAARPAASDWAATRELMTLPAQTSVSFRPARNFKEQVKP